MSALFAFLVERKGDYMETWYFFAGYACLSLISILFYILRQRTQINYNYVSRCMFITGYIIDALFFFWWLYFVYAVIKEDV